jgi:branched-chain amino acid transport system substrate-binding protein
MKKIILVGVVLALVLFSMGLASNHVSFFTLEGTSLVKIGYVGPLTGPLANLGVSIKESIELANYQNGNLFSIIYEDGACDPTKAVTAAKKLIEIDEVDVIISGVCSSSTLAIAPLTEAENIILISPTASSPKITMSGPFTYRLEASSALLASNAAKQVYEKGFRKIDIIYELNDYPVGWKDSFKEKFEMLGGEIVLEENFVSSGSDVRTALTKFKNSKSDAIIFSIISISAGNKLLNQARELGIKKQLIGNEIFSLKEMVLKSKEQLNGMLASEIDFNKKSLESKKFFADYEKRFGKELLEEVYGALAYDTYSILANGIKKCGNNTFCIKNYFDNGEKRNGLAGEYYFDEHGDAIRKVVLNRFENGEFVLLE